MNLLDRMSAPELQALASAMQSEFDRYCASGLRVNLSRGKPCASQLDLSNGIEHALAGNYHSEDGTDTRNYGGLRGIAEARRLGAELLDVDSDSVIASDNSSLTLMHWVLDTAIRQGLWGDKRRWSNCPAPKMLAPVPGYDRHFALSESLGIELLPIPTGVDGPDLQVANELASNDDSIKGIWCVPKYSNPTGCTYSSAVVAGLAALPSVAAADDFLVIWDNAYAVHDLTNPGDQLDSIAAQAASCSSDDHIVQVASTSKITFSGAGVAFLSASERVLESLEKRMSFFTIGPNKVNQLQHARFLSGRLQQHMAQHAAILRPKFELVQQVLKNDLESFGIATWTCPKGGYFVSLDTEPGLAKKTVALAQQAGLTLTSAGATFPYGQDPNDCNIRIAPTFAQGDELTQALAILVVCIKLAAVSKRQDTTE